MKKIISHPIVKNGHNIILVVASILLIVVLFYAAFFANDTNKVRAGTTDNVSGWAWSDNIGWISFNCTDTGSCATVDYGVNVDVNGDLSGYAWSDNIGWIDLGPSGGYPAAPNHGGKLTGNSFKGWARALSYGDGWDGWISLDGATYGVTKNGNNLENYAWDASDISGQKIGTGWIDFNPAFGGVIIGSTPSYICTSIPTNANICTDDWTGLSADTPSTVVTSCSVPSGSAPKCEYTCDSGYEKDGDNCVSSGSYSCTSIPTNANICTDDWTGLSADTPSTVVTSCSVPSGSAPKCEYTCDSGYEKDGDSCILAGGGTSQCSDNINNDTDTRIDANDPGCYNPSYPVCTYDPNDDTEADTLNQCSNCIDDDRDGKIDYPADPGCSNAADDREFNIGFEEI